VPSAKKPGKIKNILGTCNFHLQFIVICLQYVAPVLTVLRKESKWRWSSAMQRTFEETGEEFTYSIYLVQPEDAFD
jgi:hypothetical protein